MERNGVVSLERNTLVNFKRNQVVSLSGFSNQSLYLKTYYPMEFMVAVINNFGGFYSTELYFHELKRAGARVQAPCVNNSEELTSIRGSEVYMGLTHIQGLEHITRDVILRQRYNNGCYINLSDFIERTGLGMEQLTILIRVGAFRFTGKGKKALLWEAHMLQKRMGKAVRHEAALFKEPVKEFQLPVFTPEPFEEALDEMELLGFPLCPVFDLVDAGKEVYVPASEMHLHVGKTISMLGYFITLKPVRTVKGQLMYFGTFIDQNGDWIDSVHFPNVADQYAIASKGFYHLRGKVVEEFGVYSIEVQAITAVGLKV